ncbi:MAG: hypothetical protein AAFP15_16375, partial [Bacteroidota bacterium]
LMLCVLLAPALRRWSMLMRTGLVVPVIAVGGILATTLPNALDWVSESPYLESAQGMLNYQEGSGQGRLLQYRRSLELVQQSPLLGVGPGNWSVAYPGVAPPGDPSMSGSRPGMTSNPWPSSDAVALVSERGLLGVLAWLLFAGSLSWTAWTSLRRKADDRDADDRDAAGAGLLLAMSAGVVVTGAFDAVLLLAWPVLLVATVAGALLPAAQARSIAVPRWLRVAFFAVLVTLAGVGAVRSGGQWAAMRLYEADASRASLERAAQLDPGSYRVHLRLAQRTRGTARCPHAQTAAALYPHATAAQRLAARCE